MITNKFSMIAKVYLHKLKEFAKEIHEIAFCYSFVFTIKFKKYNDNLEKCCNFEV